jgi:molecular chaperone GrpE
VNQANPSNPDRTPEPEAPHEPAGLADHVDETVASSSERSVGPAVDLRTGDPSPSGAQPDDEGDADHLDDLFGEGATGSEEGQDETEPGVDLESLAEADPRTKAELIGAVLDLEGDRDAYLDDLRRARAEFENYRRRVTRESAAQRKAGAADAIAALLEVLDDLDRTLEAAEGSSDESLAKGVELVASKLMQGLRSLGVERIDAVGEPFDPTRHEAVQQLPAEEGTDQPIVAEVLRPGYRLYGRVLRAAMVVVQG